MDVGIGRSILQVTATTHNGIAVLIALCDDGTLWALYDDNTNEWLEIDTPFVDNK